MGKFTKPEWERGGPEGTMVWTGAFAYHLEDERHVKATVARLTGAHTVTVTSKERPADGIVQASWSYRSHGAWRHDVADVLKKHFVIVDSPAEVESGKVYLAKQGERKPASD